MHCVDRSVEVRADVRVVCDFVQFSEVSSVMSVYDGHCVGCEQLKCEYD